MPQYLITNWIPAGRRGFPARASRATALDGRPCPFYPESTVCRSIKVLRNSEPPATADDVAAAALQFVRKISGFHKPSRANQEIFDRAVREIAESSDRLLKALAASSAARVTRGPSAAARDSVPPLSGSQFPRP
jgi:hypothetical protein